MLYLHTESAVSWQHYNTAYGGVAQLVRARDS